jgi:hypothetical protein
MKSFNALLLLFVSAPVYASVSISSPSNNTDVSSPFTLSADAATCSSQPVNAISYSLDNGSDLGTISSSSLRESVSVGIGSHTLHVKAWGENGSVCVSDVRVNITREIPTIVGANAEDASTDSDGNSIPSQASSNSNIQAHSNWKEVHDDTTGGHTSGSMSLVSSPSHSGTARRFETHSSGSGGERYSDSFGDDTTATNFVYDGWIYIQGSANKIQNIELDLNQALENGNVMIYAFQCSGSSGRWEYGINAGSVDHHKSRWERSGVSCNPRDWSVDAWHHVEIAYSRDGSSVTYKSITFDGRTHVLDKKVLGEFGLHWGRILQTNFQIDGLGTGSSTVYLDDLTIYRW